MFVEDAGGRKKKLGLPFQCRYRVVQADDNNVEVRPVGRPDETSRSLNVERVRLCPQEIPDVPCPRRRRRKKRVERTDLSTCSSPYELRSTARGVLLN